MYHSIAFLDYYEGIWDSLAESDEPFKRPDAVNTWDDWHLIPSSRPVINPPTVRTQFVSIPGLSGDLDLTEALTGFPTYGNRTGSLEFIVANGYRPWDVAYSRIMEYLQGKKKVIILEDERNYAYEGRFWVSEWKSDKAYSLITIEYNIQPYKRYILKSGERWLWDPFDFVNGYLDPNYDAEFQLSGSSYSNISFDCDNGIVRPRVYVTDPQYPYGEGTATVHYTSQNTKVEHYGDFTSGKWIDDRNFVLEPGITSYIFTASKNVTMRVTYRKEVF